MDRSAPDYSDHQSGAPYTNQQEVRSATYSASGTPTSEYSVYPTSSRSSSFPEHIQRPYHSASNPSGGSGAMAQTSTNPSIAATSPTYAHGQYSPYAPPPADMAHGYQPAGTPMYAQPRPDWAGYGQPGAPITPGHHVFPQTPTTAAPGRPNQVYSFVPIPGAQQHKRPRRRYEEIERMYKCGWNGCEKAYGTLNHLNAHVTMQGHGTKRTPEEFKEIRREWKARKKEEEAARKAAEEERQRQAAATAAAAAQNGGSEAQVSSEGSQTPTTYASARPVQLPPIGYQPPSYPTATPSGGIQQAMPEYGGNHVYSSYSSAPPTYGQSPNQQMYSQHNGGQAPSH
ncbi:hypothetical protein VTK26DRAFT_2438 [Humicola hyalothermophila]